MIDKLLGRFIRWGITSSLRNHPAYGCVEHDQTVFHLIGCNPVDQGRLRMDLAAGSPADVLEMLCADFDIAEVPQARLPVVYFAPDAWERDSVAKALGVQARIDPCKWELFHGCYDSVSGMVIVSGELGTNEFRTTLLHELVHGFSDVVLDAMGAVPWAMEGYAELVAARVSAVRGDPGPWILRRSIATILALRDNAQIASVARLMRVSQREFAEFLKTYPWFTAHSGLLLCMFTSWCSRKPGVLEACRNGIRAECSDPSALASALEQAAGLDSDGMDAAFLNYCAELESRMQRPGPTLSADAMQLHC